MAALDFPPAKHEIVEEMKRILASDRFQKAMNPSGFLALTVTRALRGQKTTGTTIAQALFRKNLLKKKAGAERVLALSLRKLLKLYFEREGANDLVVIEYPEPKSDPTIKPVIGEAYTPVFKYNPRHGVHTSLKTGFRLLEKGMYRDYDHALKLFAAILDGEPDNLGAVIGLVECLCKFNDRHWDNPVHAHPFIASENVLSKVAERGAKYWRFWAARAYLHQARGKDLEAVARDCYKQALSLDKRATEGYLPYIEFLSSIGDDEEALVLAQRYVDERVEDPVAIAQFGILLACVGRAEQGITAMNTALGLDPNNCLAHDALTTIYIVRRDFKTGAKHLRKLRQLCDPESFAWIVKFLMLDRGQDELRDAIEKFLLKEKISVPA